MSCENVVWYLYKVSTVANYVFWTLQYYQKREQEEASEEETDPIEVLKSVGELGKGFVKDIYSLKAPWLMS